MSSPLWCLSSNPRTVPRVLRVENRPITPVSQPGYTPTGSTNHRPIIATFGNVQWDNRCHSYTCFCIDLTMNPLATTLVLRSSYCRISKLSTDTLLSLWIFYNFMGSVLLHIHTYTKVRRMGLSFSYIILSGKCFSLYSVNWRKLSHFCSCIIWPDWSIMSLN